jgi:hypothetical protein
MVHGFEKPGPIETIQLEESDIISFHSYTWPEEFESRVLLLQKYHRPLFFYE